MEIPRRNRLAGKSIFLSAGVPAGNGDDIDPRVADTAEKIESAVIAVARAVFFEGGTLVLGADANIAPLVVTVLRQYTRPAPAEAISRNDLDLGPGLVIDFSDPDDRRFFEVVRFVSGGDPHIQFWTPEDDRAVIRENERARSESRRLLLMRRREVSAMVVIGGTEAARRDAEQFQQAFQHQPVFLFAGTGGAAERLLSGRREGWEPAPEEEYTKRVARFWSERRRPGAIDRNEEMDRREERKRRDDSVERIYTPYNVIAEWLLSRLSGDERPFDRRMGA